MITVIGPSISIEDLREDALARPDNAGRRWRGIQHGHLVDTLKTDIEHRGWRITKEHYATSPDKATAVGAFLLSNITGVETTPNVVFAIGFLNDNARRKALQITVGASVVCCANGMCTGTIVLNRVHDHTIDLVRDIHGAIDRYSEAVKQIPSLIARLRSRTLSPEEASEIILSSGRRGLIGWAAVGRIDKEYQNPTFRQHGVNTSWALLNAFTFAARKNIAPTRQMETYQKFLEMLPQQIN